MIKVEKDLENIPASLKSDLTKQRREEIIAAKEYPTSLKKLKANPVFEVKTLDPYNNRYKYKDIKERLAIIYNKKCSYCEQRVESYHVEHYRPKTIYYWLAYSWDNLFYCCPKCNGHKLDNFEVEKRVAINQFPIDEIQNLRGDYDKFEKPRLINPEKENISKHLVFEKDGSITSEEPRVCHTINTIKLDREPLKNLRFELYNDFEKKTISRIAEYRSGDKDAKIKLKGLIEDFVYDSKNSIKEFISFRKYIIKHWLKKLVKDLTT